MLGLFGVALSSVALGKKFSKFRQNFKLGHFPQKLVRNAAMFNKMLRLETGASASALYRSRRELSNAYLLAKIGADTAENERNFAVNFPRKSGNYPTPPL